jgi:hypothetical protein
MPRWLPLLIAALIGIALGLIYGWAIDPVQFVDTTPETLRADYRADYVLMVAEAYHTEGDPAAAARRLAILGSLPPAQIAGQALQTGRMAGYSPADLALLDELTRAMQAYGPAPAGATP